MCKEEIKTYSIISVISRKDGKVKGYWVQDCVGTLTEAKERANQYSELNRGQDTAVTDGVPSPTPALNIWHNLIEL